jgi:hypothetical protein
LPTPRGDPDLTLQGNTRGPEKFSRFQLSKTFLQRNPPNEKRILHPRIEKR